MDVTMPVRIEFPTTPSLHCSLSTASHTPSSGRFYRKSKLRRAQACRPPSQANQLACLEPPALTPTGVELFRYAVFVLEIRKALAEQNFLLDFETVLDQVAHPVIAATSRGGFIDGDRGRRRFSLRVNEAER